MNQFCCGVTSEDPWPPCQCTSTKPGKIVLPEASKTCAPSGIVTSAAGPTAVMRFFSTTIVPFSMTSSPRIVISRAPVSATAPSGTSLTAVKPIGLPSATGSGNSSGAPSMKAKASDSVRS